MIRIFYPVGCVLVQIYLGLRTVEGLPSGSVPGPKSAEWVDRGWARVADRRLRLTPEGWLRLDALVASL